MMHSESGNKYPVGKPKFWVGNFIPPEAIAENKYYFVRVKTRFYIKKNMLPFIQIKGSFLYKGTEALETSDIYDKDNILLDKQSPSDDFEKFRYLFGNNIYELRR